MSDRSHQHGAVRDGGQIRIRPGRPADAGGIGALLEAMGGHDGVSTKPGFADTVAAAATGSGRRLLVATTGSGSIVGVLDLEARINVGDATTDGWIGILAVAADRRGAGIGARLIDHAAERATALGCDRLVLESSTFRDGAHAFWTAVGFDEHRPAKRFVRDLRDDRGG